MIVPAGRYSNGAPFGLIFLGRPFSEAELLNYAYDYEQATQHRFAPILVPEPSTISTLTISVMVLIAILRRNKPRFWHSSKASSI